MGYSDRSVHVAELDLRAAGADLTVETVSDVLAMFDLYAEVGRDAAVNCACTNCRVCIRRNDQRHVSVNGRQRDWLRFGELSKRSFEWSIDGRQLRFAQKTTRGDASVDRRRFDRTFNAVDVD